MEETKVYPQEEQVLEEIRKAIREIDYGLIQIVVHGSSVVQIDKTKKIRFETQEKLQKPERR